MFLKRLIRLSSRFIGDTLLPPTCLFCGYSTQLSLNICYNCQQELPILSHNCHRCAQFLPDSQSNTRTCGACLNNPPPFDRTFALFSYEPPIIKLIIALKFQQQLSHAKLLGDLLTQQIQQHWYRDKPLPNIILPIPLHPQRLRERGFNQALEIAKPIASKLGLPLDKHGVIRIKSTTPQSGLLASKRKRISPMHSSASVTIMACLSP